MKKLVYFWCDELRGFEDKEFNFSSRYNIQFDQQTATLTIKNGDANYIDHFFGEDIELNVIVGNNGVGKSSMLKKLFRVFRNTYFEAPCVLVFEEKGGLSVFFMDKSRRAYQRNIEFSWLDKVVSLPFSDEIPDNRFQRFYNQNVSFLTLLFDMEMYEDGFDEEDLLSNDYSMGGLMRDKSVVSFSADKNLPEGKRLWDLPEGKRLWAREFELNMNFLNHIATSSENPITLPFAVPDGVWVFIDNRLEEELSSLLSEPRKNISNFDKNNDISSLVKSSGFVPDSFCDSTSIYNCFMSAMLASLLSYLSRMPEAEINYLCQRNQCRSLYELVSGWLRSDEFKEKQDTAEKLAYIFDKLNDSEPYIDSDYLDPYRKLLELFQRASRSQASNQMGYGFTIPFKAKDVSISVFFQAHASLNGNGFLRFSWGLSSGETAMLDLYSKFYNIKHNIQQLTKKENRLRKATRNKAITDILLMIDEADACFHPQWQKEYVKDMLSVAGQIFRGFAVQILLATHSPIMLSDIPKQNVIYLKKENKDAGTKVIPREERQETFGADIFSLFKDSFFLEGSGIGSFAEDKLEELLRAIHSLGENQRPNMSPKEIFRRIQCIGDSFIRRKFENELEKYTKSGTRAALQNRRELLRKELEKIEQELGESLT